MFKYKTIKSSVKFVGEEKPDWREERGWKVGAMWLREGGREEKG